jgi:hypothetical protein
MRVSLSRSAFEMLERCALKKARTVLRGREVSNDLLLPDEKNVMRPKWWEKSDSGRQAEK